MNIYDFNVKKASGESVSLGDYRGKVMLIVNTASKCGFTPQFEGLEKLWQKYKDKGLVILGFPCNQFGEQDPGSNDEIQSFCKINYGVTFPVFAKIEVNGEGADPLYKFLKSEKSFAGFDPVHELTPVLEKMLGEADPNYAQNPDIKWNFTKFLIDKEGNVLARYEPTTTPEALDGILAKMI